MSWLSEHKGYMGQALEQGRRALDNGEFPVGCVLVYQGAVVARGHRLNSRDGGNELDHAEIVTVRTLLAAQPGITAAKITVYSTMEPCLMCLSTLMLSGIRNIVFGYEDVMGGGSKLDLSQLPPLYAAMEVSFLDGILREECLKLFQAFFNNPKNRYWQDSLLAAYTLAQKTDQDG